MPRSSVRALSAACLLALTISIPASGHAALESSSPAPDEHVTVAPTELVARFTQDLRADRTSIELRDPTGQTIAKGGKDPDRARVQRLVLPALAPGAYEVRWVTWSAEDDEIERGRYMFTVAEPVLAPSPMPSPTACGSPSPLATPGASPASTDPVSSSPGPSLTASPAAGPSLGSGQTPDPCVQVSPMPTISPAASLQP